MTPRPTSHDTPVEPPAGTPAEPTPRSVPPPMLDSRTVLQGRSSVAIEHNGAVYRLQTTRQGKLILTK